jgi:hypothetical protein
MHFDQCLRGTVGRSGGARWNSPAACAGSIRRIIHRLCGDKRMNYLACAALLFLAAGPGEAVVLDDYRNPGSAILSNSKNNVFGSVGYVRGSAGGCTSTPISSTVVLTAAHWVAQSREVRFEISHTDAKDVLGRRFYGRA